jgi:peptidoglycan hydrolase FlgJ
VTSPLSPSQTSSLHFSGLASDVHSMDALRARASSDPKAAAQAAAKQFEALFMNELMKSMRQSTLATGMLENSGSKMGTEMLDTQFANQMTGLPGGLSQAIAQQLERQMAASQAGVSEPTIASKPLPSRPPALREFTSSSAKEPQLSFVKTHTEAAQAAQAATGIPASFMVAQAAHESGWGQREIKNADGSSSFNVFGIKAGSHWKGPVAEVVTTEYINGEPRKVLAKFRAYSSYEESFKDYARLMQQSPRYAQVLAQATSAEGFAQGLQQAGYASDPAYAAKLSRTINTTLRLQRLVS